MNFTFEIADPEKLLSNAGTFHVDIIAFAALFKQKLISIFTLPTILPGALSLLLILYIAYFHYNYYLKQKRLKKQAEDKLLAEQTLLRTLIDTIPDYIYIKDKESRFILANKRVAFRMNAGSPENLLLKTDFDFYPHKLAQKYFEDEQYIVKTGTPLISIEEESIDENNHPIYLSTTKFPLIGFNNEIRGIVGIGRDITKLKSTEHKLVEQSENLLEINVLLQEKHEKVHQQALELGTQAESLKLLYSELEKANTTKDKFLSIIAHDLKNPFNAIINFSELMLMQSAGSLSGKHFEMLQIINSSSKTAHNLLENLLNWARTQSGPVSAIPETLDLSELVKDCIDFLEVSAKLKNIQFQTSSHSNLMVFADKNMINTVIRNVLSNAIKYSKKDSNITITFDESQLEFNQLIISDSGVGIKEKNLKKLLDDNQIVTTKGTLGETGTGLGLLISKEFMELNKGKLEIESKCGIGTTVKVLIPKMKYP